MDPKVCLEQAVDSHNSGDVGELYNKLMDYAEWRQNGGFDPGPMTTRQIVGVQRKVWENGDALHNKLRDILMLTVEMDTKLPTPKPQQVQERKTSGSGQNVPRVVTDKEACEVAHSTLEEKLRHILQAKQKIVDQVLDSETTPQDSLDVFDLVKEEMRGISCEVCNKVPEPLLILCDHCGKTFCWTHYNAHTSAGCPMDPREYE